MATADAPPNRRPYTRDPSSPQPRGPQRPMDPLDDYDPNPDPIPAAPAPNARPQAAEAPTTGLGIDEEITIKKARKPTAKLDEPRLLSANGIPKLRRISKERLRFRGKGHEFSDIARLLGTYQLWLDGLFPKAKFADALAIVEKLGHSKRMRVMRKEWIDEGKPKRSAEDADDGADGFVDRDGEGRDEADGDFISGREEDAGANGQEDETEDIYGHSSPGGDQSSIQPARVEAEPEEDELDALLAEDAQRDKEQGKGIATARTMDVDDFADEEEAMAGVW